MIWCQYTGINDERRNSNKKNTHTLSELDFRALSESYAIRWIHFEKYSERTKLTRRDRKKREKTRHTEWKKRMIHTKFLETKTWNNEKSIIFRNTWFIPSIKVNVVDSKRDMQTILYCQFILKEKTHLFYNSKWNWAICARRCSITGFQFYKATGCLCSTSQAFPCVTLSNRQFSWIDYKAHTIIFHEIPNLWSQINSNERQMKTVSAKCVE